ncbi:adenosylcobinamide kinase/adenosylcobinamidephosphate guanylyltransferase domain protein [Leptospira borgpetersenii serovar Pomona str. 200901868]|uniref:Adenosylcobinamide kinase/adenosylcobinamidephosphate guanylyltransferase domain protein n=1 Tax=Leptospira borgpetersenii serovar Pomona str. 200901868 TaxID=1192866 RepID=M6WD67_LEPBO|nr:adenosylcobinamide kinase/adenosylcobinamidephosphate guanylyltransferase domain protein [Leptospira borgpetersenii serovar Pomona str. 200901868]
MADITLITGGCRSGKSGLALKLANEIKGKNTLSRPVPLLTRRRIKES